MDGQLGKTEGGGRDGGKGTTCETVNSTIPNESDWSRRVGDLCSLKMGC